MTESKIKYLQIKKYMEERGWNFQNSKINGLMLACEEKLNIKLFIPYEEKLSDYEIRINDIIDFLSQLYNLDKELLMVSLILGKYIKLKLCLFNDEGQIIKGTIPYQYVPDLFKEIKASLTASGNATIKSKNNYTKPFNQVELMINKCRLGQTEEGSYIINVFIPEEEEYLKDIKNTLNDLKNILKQIEDSESKSKAKGSLK